MDPTSNAARYVHTRASIAVKSSLQTDLFPEEFASLTQNRFWIADMFQHVAESYEIKCGWAIFRFEKVLDGSHEDVVEGFDCDRCGRRIGFYSPNFMLEFT